jgi:hypothetical protein
MRKNKTFKLDERLLSSLEQLAERSGTTSNNYLETLLFRHCQSLGMVPMNEQPPQGGRGGARKNAGRPKVKSEDADTDADRPADSDAD